MDETIGVKGGRNDRKRTLIITKKKKEKLEKEVKRRQAYNLVKFIPLVLVGQTIKELTNNKKTEKEKPKNSIVLDDNRKTKTIVVLLQDGTIKTIEIPKSKKEEPKQEEKNKSKEYEVLKENKEKKDETPVIKEHPVKKETKQESTKENKVKVEKQNSIPIPQAQEKEPNHVQIPVIKEKEANNIQPKKVETSEIKLEELNEKQKNKLQKLQARKIIDVYEKQLKDIRFDLRNLIIEYNTLVDEEEDIIRSKEAEIILDKLNQIIKKIEDLKDKIKIEDLNKYDDNYIYTLIEEYLDEFKDKKLVKEIKDSPLYILISEKLDEFDKMKDKFKDKVEEKKEDLEEKEEKLEELREKYYKVDKLNNDLNDFYLEQELLLREIKEKVDKAVTVTEKQEVQIEYMNNQTRSLLRRLSLLMMLRGARGAKAFAAMSAIYISMARQMLLPKTKIKKYKEIIVKDYTKDIENNIDKINEVSISISNISNNIDKLKSKIKEEFSDYIGVIPECDELLANLDKVKSNIKEKEYELEKIKEEQEKELERNNAKILTKA